MMHLSITKRLGPHGKPSRGKVQLIPTGCSDFFSEPTKVVFCPKQFVNWIKHHQPNKEIKFEHIVMLSALHEYVHTIQAKHEAADDDGRATPSPYELLNMEIEAYRLAFDWFKKIFKAEPPQREVREGYHDKYWKDGKYVGKYKRKVKEYQKLEQKIADGQTLSAKETKEKEKLETYFQKAIDEIYEELRQLNVLYDKDLVDLRCEE